MTSAVQISLVLLLSFGVADAKIEFTHSTVYEVYDFEGVAEVSLPRCNSGCLIFASAFGIYESNMDPYIRNLVIKDSANGTLATIGQLVNKFHPDTTQKLPLDIPAKGKYSILNLNPLEVDEDTIIFDVTIWIVERAKAQEIDYEIYDVKTMRRPPAMPNSVIMIMGSVYVEVDAAQSWKVNSYTLRLAGFDNAFDDNEDLCESVHSTPVGSMFDGFKFVIRAPIVSIVFANKTTIALSAKDGDMSGPYRSLSWPGYIASPGYIGCKRLGVDQVYHNMFYPETERVVITGEFKDYQVEIDIVSDLGGDSDIKVLDVSKDKYHPVAGGSGQTHLHVTISNTSKVYVDYTNVTAPHSFFLRYNATRTNRLTSPLNTTSAAVTSTAPTTTASEDRMGPVIISSEHLATTSATAVFSTLSAIAVVGTKLLAI